MNKITPFLMFNSGAGAAMEFYAEVFPNTKILAKTPGPDGTVIGGTIDLSGQIIHTYDGGPHFSFTEGCSFMVACKDQEEVDYLWNRLTADGGKESMCGWLTDKFGVSWQITPTRLMEIISHPDREKAGRGIQAMLQMKKIIIADLEKAFEGN